MATGDRRLVAALGSVGEVFFRSFETLRPSQRAAIDPVFSGRNILLACPTASGKTEALIAPLIAAILKRSSAAVGTRFLTVAPTRALVNDLHARLEPKLEELGLGCGRQTSDHRVGGTWPFLLITTPESFDSMLARRSRYGRDGKLEGHDLASVAAVFIDEAHLFDNSARGDQLLWLIARLRRLLRGKAGDAGAAPLLQVCAASATVSDPDVLARRLLGPNADVVSVRGERELLLFDGRAGDRWEPIAEADTPETLVERVVCAVGPTSRESIAAAIWRGMSAGDGQAVRKVLVFVPSRSLCDELSTVVRRYLSNRRQVEVYAHHGSLDRALRETSEAGFGSARDAVLVATSTLEVGVDIGDVDAVVLVGPPADTNGLLQRIGRSGRRLSITRVMAIARSPLDRHVLSSMLVAARDGLCDPGRYGRRWSVCVQQISSFVRQAPAVGRRAADIEELAEDVWSGDGASNARSILQHLEQRGLLERTEQGRVRFGEVWQGSWDAMGMHGNIDGNAGGTPVVDAVTGETIAHIPPGSRIPDQISLAGSNWRVRVEQGEVLLNGIDTAVARGAIRYGARRGPVGRAFGRHAALGLGVGERAIVLLTRNSERFTFHFGGSLFEHVITSLVAGLRPLSGLGGIAVAGSPARPIADAAADAKRVEDLLMDCLRASPGLVSPGPYHAQLPAAVQEQTLRELLPVEDLLEWIQTRIPTEVDAESGLGRALVALLP